MKKITYLFLTLIMINLVSAIDTTPPAIPDSFTNTSIFINTTGVVGQIYYASIINITGSEFLTLLGLIIIFMAFFMIFGIPIELTAVFILPMLITFTAYTSNIFTILGITLIYLGILLAKNWLVK